MLQTLKLNPLPKIIAKFPLRNALLGEEPCTVFITPYRCILDIHHPPIEWDTLLKPFNGKNSWPVQTRITQTMDIFISRRD